MKSTYFKWEKVLKMYQICCFQTLVNLGIYSLFLIFLKKMPIKNWAKNIESYKYKEANKAIWLYYERMN